MRCLVIGGTGFIGKNLIEMLIDNDIEVRCLDRSKIAWGSKNIEFIEGDFTAAHLLDSIFDGCDTVIHLATTVIPQTSNDDPEFDISTNLVGAVRILEASVKHKVRKVIFMSSGGTVYGNTEDAPILETHSTNPTCSYGIIKLTIEKYMRLFHQLYDLNTCSVRLANPYGRYQRGDINQGVIAVFCHKMLNGIPFEIWGDGSVRRDFIYIDDVVQALLKIINTDEYIGEINIGSGNAVSIKEIVACVQQLVNLDGNVIYKPSRNFDVSSISLDITKAQQLLGWNPKISMKEGIMRTIEWHRSMRSM